MGERRELLNMMRSENFITPGTQSTFKMVELGEKQLKTEIIKLSIEKILINHFFEYLMIAVLIHHGSYSGYCKQIIHSVNIFKNV